jgi:putative transposase
MTNDIATEAEVPLLGADWFDPLEAGIRQRIRSFIEHMLEEELAATLGRGRYDRSAEEPGIATATGTASCSARLGR